MSCLEKCGDCNTKLHGNCYCSVCSACNIEGGNRGYHGHTGYYLPESGRSYYGMDFSGGKSGDYITVECECGKDYKTNRYGIQTCPNCLKSKNATLGQRDFGLIGYTGYNYAGWDIENKTNDKNYIRLFCECGKNFMTNSYGIQTCPNCKRTSVGNGGDLCPRKKNRSYFNVACIFLHKINRVGKTEPCITYL